MPERNALLHDLQGEDRYGIWLLAQIGGAPNELQLIVETAVYDPAVEGLRAQSNYIIRALGVHEHRLHLGVFGRLAFLDDHPLLYHLNTPRTAVHFTGKPAQLDTLVLDISQAYVSTFGPWRNVATMGEDLNITVPLTELLGGGFGLLGTMPKPLAERMARVLAHHGMTASLSEDTSFEEKDEHGRSRAAKLLLIDDAYILAFDFSVERMNGRGTQTSVES